ncbi:MAG TPA: hypothetical protein VM243_04555 [Phycisphaerae bacterium]|nr:hypothetical protein [Phycisphaerae bacterium]
MPTIYDFDGFEDYATAGILREHVRVNGAPTIVSGGRNGGSRLRCSAAQWVCRAFPSALTEFCISGYFESNVAATSHFLGFRNALYESLQARLASDGSLAFYACASSIYAGGDFGDNVGYALLGATPSALFVANEPVHVAVEVLLGATTGEIHVYRNGVLFYQLLNVNTNGSGLTPTITNFLLGSKTTAVIYADDVIVSSASVGDRRVDSHFPTADGDHQDGTPSTGSDHYAVVDEAPEPNDDTDYVTLATADDRESYGCEAFKNSGATIDAVMVVLDAKKTDAGTATLAASVRTPGSPGADFDGTAVGVSTTYGRQKEVYQWDPASGSPAAAWDEAGFNAAEFGAVKVA